MKIEWSTIEKIAQTKALEVIINFAFGTAIQRCLESSGNVHSTHQKALNTYFGSEDWYDVAYQRTDDLFGSQTQKVEDAPQRVTDWYRDNLKKIFGNVSSARPVYNTRGNLLYHLIWAGPNPLGAKIAEEILPKIRAKKSE